MNKEPIKSPSFLAKKMLFGENVIYHCKAHKGIWGIPLMIVFMGIAFLISLSLRDEKILSEDIILLGPLFFWFLISFFIYLGTDIVLTDKRIIARQFFRTEFLNLERISIITAEDLLSKVNGMNNGIVPFSMMLSRSSNLLGWFLSISILLDTVSVDIIDKNGASCAVVRFMSASHHKKLQKLFNEESLKYSDF